MSDKPATHLIVVQATPLCFRAVRLDHGRLAAFSLAPTSLADPHQRLRPLPGDIFLGRVRQIAKDISACFIELGLGESALLPLDPREDRPLEGAALIVQVRRPAQGGKGPRVSRRIEPPRGAPDLTELTASAARMDAPATLFQLDPLARALSDVQVDGDAPLISPRGMVGALKAAMPGAETRIEPSEDDDPFAALELDDQVSALCDAKVVFGQGAWLMIEPTEALIAIDVNSGTDRRGRAAINLEAAQEIARQIILRDLGGRIAIDFIDGRDHGGLRPAIADLSRALSRDATKSRLCGPSPLGLVEIERQRQHRGLCDVMLYQADEAFRAAIRCGLAEPARRVHMRAGQALHDWLVSRPHVLGSIGGILGFAPRLALDPQLPLKAFAIEAKAP